VGEVVAAVMTFDEFARTRLPSLLRVAKALCVDRGTAEDVVQEVLLRAYERWDAIAVVDRPEAYVRRMIVNEYLSWRRKWVRISAAPDLVDLEATGDPAGPVADRLELAGEIARLPARQRAVIVLRYMAGLSDADIAKELGCSAGTVRSHASRALDRLRVQIDRVGEVDTYGDRLAH
jgi:RNA polymerase sigma-70 factor (sigma-E family)